MEWNGSGEEPVGYYDYYLSLPALLASVVFDDTYLFVLLMTYCTLASMSRPSSIRVDPSRPYAGEGVPMVRLAAVMKLEEATLSRHCYRQARQIPCDLKLSELQPLPNWIRNSANLIPSLENPSRSTLLQHYVRTGPCHNGTRLPVLAYSYTRPPRYIAMVQSAWRQCWCSVFT
jgi:hypothetical protein